MTITGASETGTPILGIFNVSKHTLTELVSLSNFSGTISAIEYVVRAHTSGLVSAPAVLDSPRSLYTVSLDRRGYEILCAFPAKSLAGHKHENVSIATLGLIDKMTGCVAIVSNAINSQYNGRIMIDVKLKALGVLGECYACMGYSSTDMAIRCLHILPPYTEH